ncbi:MAG: PaaI family thioesterase [Caenispirillum bisanense]|nr:PaaI family thioesterase [Caenispirillum bisanense]MCA1973013.1 PaaI family thioesterase [Caenispirillum sp.]
MAAAITLAEFNRIIEADAPFVPVFGIETLEIGDGTATLRVAQRPDLLRGPRRDRMAEPVLMGLADLTLYGVVLSHVGPVALAVTTSMAVDILEPPGASSVIARGRTLKAGKRLVVAAVTITAEDDGRPIAHCTGTYSIPPRR